MVTSHMMASRPTGGWESDTLLSELEKSIWIAISMAYSYYMTLNEDCNTFIERSAHTKP